MSIAADAPWLFIKLRRSGMCIRRFIESCNVREICIATMNRRSLLPLPPGRTSLVGGEGRGEEAIGT
jgi:hypothetical protein